MFYAPNTSIDKITYHLQNIITRMPIFTLLKIYIIFIKQGKNNHLKNGSRAAVSHEVYKVYNFATVLDHELTYISITLMLNTMFNAIFRSAYKNI